MDSLGWFIAMQTIVKAVWLVPGVAVAIGALWAK